MAAEITLCFDANPGEAGEAPMQVEVVSSDLEVTASAVCHLRDMPTFFVKPGPYLVRGRLPSGEWMSTQTSVVEGWNPRIMLRPFRRSPREDLTWAYYLRANPLLEDEDASRRATTTSLLKHHTPGPVRYCIWRYAPSDHWTRIEDGIVGSGLGLRISAEEDARAVGVIDIDLNRLDPNRGPDGRYWLALESEWFPPRFIAVPISSRQARVLVRFVGNKDGGNDPLQVIVNTQDAMVEALLNLITKADYSAARSIGESNLPEAQKLISGEIGDPMAASVAGYFLLMAGDPHRMHWSERFADRTADALPDGALIHAWYLLRCQHDPERALGYLMKAASCGVPFYTCGLRLLVDGLMLFGRERGSKSLHDSRECISQYAAAADWKQPTTTWFCTEPNVPKPRVDLDSETFMGSIRLHRRQLA